MRPSYRRLALALILSSAPPVRADERKDFLDLKKIRFTARDTRPVGGFYDCRSSTFFEVGKDGIAFTNGLTMATGYLKKGGGPVVHFPSIRDGDFFPLFGALYKATVTPDPDGSLVAEWIHPDDFPAGVKLDTDSIAIPLGRTQVSYGTFNTRLVRVRAIEERDKKLEATLDEVYDEETFGTVNAAGGTVRVGDVYIYSTQFNFGVKVRRIVPPNAKTRIIGWVEFEPETLGEAELKKFNGKIVRPVKRDTPAK